jgi:hypothetical protein
MQKRELKRQKMGLTRLESPIRDIQNEAVQTKHAGKAKTGGGKCAKHAAKRANG